MDVEAAEHEVLPSWLNDDHLPDYISMEVHVYYLIGSILANQLIGKGNQIHVTTDGSEQPSYAEISAFRTNVQ